MADLETITIGELPTITEIGENDTVLLASGGRMKKASPSLVGGGSTLVVTASYSGDPNGTWTATLNKTYAEIEEAFLKGTVVIDNSASYAFFGDTAPTGAKAYVSVYEVGYASGNYIVYANVPYEATTKNDYPIYSSEGSQ